MIKSGFYFILFYLLLTGSRVGAQTIMFQTGFETGDPAMTYSCGSCTGGLNNGATNARTGTNAGFINGGATKSYDGSIITGVPITFTAGRFYTIEVYSKVAVCGGSLDIRKSLTATNAAMLAAAGADIILNGTSNVSSTAYSLYSALYVAGVTETKYVGFQLNSAGGGPCSNLAQYIDDILITEYTDAPCAYYCAAGGTSGTPGSITNVEFNTISRASGFDGYVCTGLNTTVQLTVAYNLTIDVNNNGYPLFTQAWIDWNKDGDYADAGEIVMASASNSTTGLNSRTVSVTVPGAATIGRTKMRVAMKYNAAINAAGCEQYTYMDVEDYDIDVAPAPTPMTYVSSTTTQANTSSVNAGTFKNEIIGLQIVTSGTLSPISATSFTFNTTGTTNAAADLLNAELWYSSNNASFSTATQVGTVVANPNGTFSFTGSIQLIQGTNYFWLTYDILSSATSPDVVDAQCTSVTVAGTPRTPSVTAPAGNRPIVTATPMTYVSSTVTQNSSRTPRPDTNHHIIGIEVVTSGAASPLQATSFSFNTTGTTAPATNILNARLWSTGISSSFATTTQIGATIAAPNGAFTITPAATLFSGTNYFWLTYDIPASAGCDPAQADAQCTSITIGGTPRTPTVTSPLGAVIIDCNTAYYSKGSLPANLPSSWNTKRDGSGTDASSFGTSSMFYVQRGHTMSTTATATIPFMTVEAGGMVKASYLLTMTDLRINSFGVFEQIVQAADGSYIANFYIENYGTWIHNNAGALPDGNRYFSPRSNQWFYQWGAGTFPSGTAWGNVLLNGITPGNFAMGNCLTTIQGDFEWRRIGNGNYLLDQVDETINIGGDLIFSGGWWKVAYDNSTPGNQTRLVTINVTGDLIMKSGTLEDYSRGDNATALTLNIGGDVEITGGVLNLNLSPGGASVTNLMLGTANTTWTQTGGTVTLGNTNIKSGKKVTMTGTKLGNVGASRSLIVETGGKLYCSNYPVSGSGNFTLQTGALLGIGSAAGITSSGATGNIQVTGTRSYNSGASLEYYEGLTPQITGVFTTTTTSGTYPVQIANLIINKTASSNIVTLSSTADVTGTLTLTNGILTTSYFSNTAPWVRIPTTGSVSPIGGSASSYVDGYIRKAGSAAFTFPTGNSGKWRRIAVTAPSASTEFEARYIGTPYVNTTSMAAAPAVVLDHVSKVEYWMLAKPLGADAATVKAQLFWEDAAASGILKFDSLGVGRWNGSGWENTNCYSSCPPNWTTSTAQRTYTGSASGNGAGTIQSNTLTGTFGPFTFSTIGITANNPLPVELLHFNAECRSTDVRLRWSTSSESENDFFTILKSENGKTFLPLGKMDGSGNSSTLREYSFVDLKRSDKAFYQLLQTDYNGKSEDLGIVALNCPSGGKLDLNAWYNHSGKIIIRTNRALNADLVLELIDATGKKIIRSKMLADNGFEYSLDAENLSEGVYFLNASDGIQRQTIKLVKD